MNMVDRGLHDRAVHRGEDISLAWIWVWRKFDHMNVAVDPRSISDQSPSRTNRDMQMEEHPLVNYTLGISIALVVVDLRSAIAAAPE